MFRWSRGVRAATLVVALVSSGPMTAANETNERRSPCRPAADTAKQPSPAPPPSTEFPLGPTITLGISGGTIVLGAIVGAEAIHRADELALSHAREESAGEESHPLGRQSQQDADHLARSEWRFHHFLGNRSGV